MMPIVSFAPFELFSFSLSFLLFIHFFISASLLPALFRPGQKSDSDFWAFLARKIRKSEENQNKNQLTNTSINLGVMGISTLVLHSTYVYQ